jgi:hypothetical protein
VRGENGERSELQTCCRGRKIGRRAARETEPIALADVLERVRGNCLPPSRIPGISDKMMLNKITVT